MFSTVAEYCPYSPPPMRASPLSFSRTRLYLELSFFSIQPQLEANKSSYLNVLSDPGDSVSDKVLHLFRRVFYERLQQETILIGSLYARRDIVAIDVFGASAQHINSN